MTEDIQIESMVTITGAEYVRLMAENAKLRAALEEVMPFVEFQLHKMMEERNTIPITRALGLARAALGGDND